MYTDDPNTRRLATHCVCCGLPLRDAVSVETGIGPICREKHGYGEAVTDENRSEANRLVHAAGVAAKECRLTDLFGIADLIEALGFAKLAGVIRDRYIDIKLTDPKPRGDRVFIAVFTPYAPDFNGELRRRVPAAAILREDDEDGKFKCWRVDGYYKRELLGALACSFGGKQGLGEKGVFAIPTREEYAAKYATPPVR